MLIFPNPLKDYKTALISSSLSFLPFVFVFKNAFKSEIKKAAPLLLLLKLAKARNTSAVTYF